MVVSVEAPVFDVAPASEMPVQVAEAAPVVAEAITQIAEPFVAPPTVEPAAFEPVASQAPVQEAVAVKLPEVEEMPVAPAVEVDYPAESVLGRAQQTLQAYRRACQRAGSAGRTRRLRT